MNRLNFFRTLLASIGAMKAGKVENIIPEVVTPIATDLPGIGMQSFSIWVGPGQFHWGDLILTRLGDRNAKFFVWGKNERGNLVAKSVETYFDTRTQKETYIEVELIEADDLWKYSQQRAVKTCSATLEDSGSKTSIYGEI